MQTLLLFYLSPGRLTLCQWNKGSVCVGGSSAAGAGAPEARGVQRVGHAPASPPSCTPPLRFYSQFLKTNHVLQSLSTFTVISFFPTPALRMEGEGITCVSCRWKETVLIMRDLISGAKWEEEEDLGSIYPLSCGSASPPYPAR